MGKLENVLESTKDAVSLEILCNNTQSSGSDEQADLIGNQDGESTTIEESLSESSHLDDVGETLDSELYGNLLQDDVDAVLKMLPPRERNILRMRFGLTPIDDMQLSLVDIGAAYGLTRERVRQMEARALNKLRQPELKVVLEKYVKNDLNDLE